MGLRFSCYGLTGYPARKCVKEFPSISWTSKNFFSCLVLINLNNGILYSFLSKSTLFMSWKENFAWLSNFFRLIEKLSGDTKHIDLFFCSQILQRLSSCSILQDKLTFSSFSSCSTISSFHWVHRLFTSRLCHFNYLEHLIAQHLITLAVQLYGLAPFVCRADRVTGKREPRCALQPRWRRLRKYPMGTADTVVSPWLPCGSRKQTLAVLVRVYWLQRTEALPKLNKIEKDLEM